MPYKIDIKSCYSVLMKHPTPIPLIDTIDNLSDANPSNPGLAAVIDFLRQYSANKATFESYRRETERLLQWAQYIANKCILTLQRDDIITYIEFCLDPPTSWIGTTRAPRFIEQQGARIPNPKWRPFVVSISKRSHKMGDVPDKIAYQLSQKAIREIFSVLSSFYNYLVQDEKISNNPVALVRQKSKFMQTQQSKATVMRLSEKQWQHCLRCAQIMADHDPAKHE